MDRFWGDSLAIRIYSRWHLENHFSKYSSAYIPAKLRTVRCHASLYRFTAFFVRNFYRPVRLSSTYILYHHHLQIPLCQRMLDLNLETLHVQSELLTTWGYFPPSFAQKTTSDYLFSNTTISQVLFTCLLKEHFSWFLAKKQSENI